MDKEDLRNQIMSAISNTFYTVTTRLNIELTYKIVCIIDKLVEELREEWEDSLPYNEWSGIDEGNS